MSSLSCTFCAHRNPEGSKFCNACGSPLNLAPCPRCEAINNLANLECSQCGALLSPSAAIDAAADGSTSAEAPQSAAQAPVSYVPLPPALAERLEALSSNPPARSDEAQRTSEDQTASPAAAIGLDSGLAADDDAGLRP